MYRPKTIKAVLKEILQDRWFQVGLVIKLLLAVFFASEFLTELFAPFIKSAVSEGFWDVYSRTYTSVPNAFPYPPIMLYVLALPRFIISLFVGTDNNAIHLIDLFVTRIPLLIADISLLAVLVKWLKKKKKLIIWYWFNPIIVYVTYIHGQLDVIPVALLAYSLYFLFNNKHLPFVVLLALACCAKVNIVVTIPILLLYLYKSQHISFRHILYGSLLFIALVIALNFPFILSDGYFKMVYENQEQGKVFTSVFVLFSIYDILFIPATYLIVLFGMSSFRFLTKDLLMIFLALSFGIFTFFIVPRQGWYLWNIPFFIYFLVKFKFKHKWLFIGLNVAYFIFFIITPLSDFPRVAKFIVQDAATSRNLYGILTDLGINANILLQLSFTFLQTLLLLFCYSIFKEGIWEVKNHKIFHHPYVIGICGDSGSGKSTLSTAIGRLLGSNNVALVRGDDMHRWERGHDKWNDFTHLNPMANELHEDMAQLLNLKSGKKIARRLYDHNTGKFVNPKPLEPNKIIVYEGLHAFYLKGMARIYDLKIFMKPEEELRRWWKIDRDVNKRGYSSEKVIEQLEKRAEDSVKYIHSQEEEADIVFSMSRLTEGDNIDYNDPDNVKLHIQCANDIYFENLINALKKTESLEISHHIDKKYQLFIFSGSILSEEIHELTDVLAIDFHDILENNPDWMDGLSGIMQLFIALYMLNEIKKISTLYSVDITNSDDE